MNKNKKLIIATVFICILFSGINVFASTSKKLSTETLAVTLVIDTSGSMATTDPQKLRETAANIFIDLLSPEDYLGIITFNTKEEVVIPMQQVQNSQNKANFEKVLSQKLQSTGDTDYLIAFNEASRQLSSVKKENVRKVIIFLTDGDPDPNNAKKNEPEFMNPYMDSLWKAVSDLASNKYEVYSVGFSKGVDPAILQRISKSTGGTLKISEDSSELVINFFDILGNLKNRRAFLSKTFELKESINLDFDLDKNTSQATMVFTNRDSTPFDVTLCAPDGKSAGNAVTINKADKYNIVTINQKNEKLAGRWQINLKGNGSINAFGNEDLFNKSGIATSDAAPPKDVFKISDNRKAEGKKHISIGFTEIKDSITPIAILMRIFVVVMLLIIILGLLLYRILVYRKTLIEGKLVYWRESDLDSEDKKEFNLSKLKKHKIIITFNKENKNAQYHIVGSQYDYNIELICIVEKSRWKFIDGYIALFNKNISSELLLKTTEPGIFIYEDKVFTSKKIYKNDKFITSGYVFQYVINHKGKSTDKDKGKDVLKK